MLTILYRHAQKMNTKDIFYLKRKADLKMDIRLFLIT